MPDTLHIADLFPDCVATACRRIGNNTGDLYPQELELITKAIDKRRHEFAAGRACAREALAAIGYAPAPILQAASSAPLWPAGILGTISHSHTWAGAAVSRVRHLAGIGLDIETVGRITMNIARKVLTGAETAVMQNLPPGERQAFLALLFSAKEAVYKCLSPVVPVHMGFHDAEVQKAGPACFEVRMSTEIAQALPACASLTGHYFFHDGCVFTGIVLAALNPAD
jgi:phosphopantetheine--protein transferase-like protein